MAADNFADAEKSLKENGEFSSLTQGNSMFPLFRTHKDIVIIKPPVFPLEKDDVPLYRKNGRKELVLHRILKRKGDVYVIRGDNTYAKEYVKQSDIVGVLSGFFRNGKYYNCKESKPYKAYVFAVKIFYPFRFLWKRIIRVAIVKVLHCVKLVVFKICGVKDKSMSFKQFLCSKKK